VNCAALPTELLVSELFGHERGAFTGALDRRAGLIAAADGGTLLLDEIGDLPLVAQAMLLRFLQEKEVRPVGATRAVRVDVRVVAATNRDLERATAQGAFRADLLDRLREVVITVPPLRARSDDIPLLVDHFLVMQSHRHDVPVPEVGSAAIRALRGYRWPGNVRELEHAVSRAVIETEDGMIRPADLGLGDDDAGAGVTDEVRSGDRSSHRAYGGLTSRQSAVLRLAERSGSVRRADLIARFGISREAARQDLVALVRAGVLTRSGACRGTVYRAISAPDHSAAPPGC
jgi:DNA-binding NtrC family response regulator